VISYKIFGFGIFSEKEIAFRNGFNNTRSNPGFRMGFELVFCDNNRRDMAVDKVVNQRIKNFKGFVNISYYGKVQCSNQCL